MGLGLTTVYGILKQAGATIDVQSRPDQGTRFTLSFPTASRALTANSRAVRSDSRPTGTETVLVIEDDDSIRALIARILTVRGYGVLLASRGAEAMRIARDSSRTVDLVISDIVLPEMTGPEIVEALQRENAGLRILYISGYPNEATPLFGVLDPDDNFLMKPFLPSQLAVRVREILDRTL
jgi:CheY-like chemotaxis protein